MHERAGTPATESDLIDVDALIRAYYDLHPDVAVPEQRVVFGTSGHRGSSLKTGFNEDHILATTQAIVEYRASQGITGPLFIGADTHALSGPAQTTAVDVLVGNQVRVLVDEYDDYVPTSTSSAVVCAGPLSACVSAPMNSGPVMPCDARYSTMACVMARMWSSLNAVLKAEPRWPDVPNATRCSGIETSGFFS